MSTLVLDTGPRPTVTLTLRYGTLRVFPANAYVETRWPDAPDAYCGGTRDDTADTRATVTRVGLHRPGRRLALARRA